LGTHDDHRSELLKCHRQAEALQPVRIAEKTLFQRGAGRAHCPSVAGLRLEDAREMVLYSSFPVIYRVVCRPIEALGNLPVGHEPVVIVGGGEHIERVRKVDAVCPRVPLQEGFLRRLVDETAQNETPGHRISQRRHAAELLKATPKGNAAVVRDSVALAGATAGLRIVPASTYGMVGRAVFVIVVRLHGEYGGCPYQDQECQAAKESCVS